MVDNGKEVRATALGRAAWKWWAQHGVPVFPCSSTKRPLTKHGFKDAVTERDDVYALFSAHPNAKYIGIVTGKPSGIFVIDFDLYKGQQAEAVKNDLLKDGLLPPTRVHATKSGGEHHLYTTDFSKQDVRNGVPFDGVEVRGTGGYVIAPPSQGYTVSNDLEVAEAPQELIDKLRGGIKKFNRSPSEYLENVVLDGSNFHEALLLLAARRQENNEDRAETQKYLMRLVEASVASRQEHPRHGRWQALIKDQGKELSRIVSSAYRKFNTEGSARRLREAKRTKDRSKGQHDTKDDEKGDKKDEATGFARSYDISDIRSTGHDKPYVVHPLMMEGDVLVLSADPKAGKSLFAMTLALHMSSGRALGQLMPVRETGEATTVPVVYFALEGQSALRARILGWLAETGVSEKDVAMHVVEEGLDFTSPLTRKYIVDNLVALEENYIGAGYGPLGLIVIDTLTKAMPGKDQNKVEDTSEVFDVVRHLRDAGINACVLYLHHNRRDGEMPRGSSNIMAEPDTVLRLRKNKDRMVEGQLSTTIELSVYMARAIDDTFSQEYLIDEVEVGNNSQNIPIKSAFLRHVEATEPPVSKSSQRLATQVASKEEQEREAFFGLLIETLAGGASYSVAGLEQLINSNPLAAKHYNKIKGASKKGLHWLRIEKQFIHHYPEFGIIYDPTSETVSGRLNVEAALKNKKN